MNVKHLIDVLVVVPLLAGFSIVLDAPPWATALTGLILGYQIAAKDTEE